MIVRSCFSLGPPYELKNFRVHVKKINLFEWARLLEGTGGRVRSQAAVSSPPLSFPHYVQLFVRRQSTHFLGKQLQKPGHPQVTDASADVNKRLCTLQSPGVLEVQMQCLVDRCQMDEFAH